MTDSTLSLLFQPIWKSFQKLIDMEIVEFISTGDKKRDISYTALALAISTVIFTIDFSVIFYWITHYKNYLLNKKILLLGPTREFYSKNVITEDKKMISFTWHTQSAPEFTKQFITYCVETLLLCKKELLFDPSNEKYIEKADKTTLISVISESLESKKLYPVWVQRNKFIVITHINSGIYICHNDENFFREFLAEIKKIKVSSEVAEPESDDRCIFIPEKERQKKKTLYADRVFDKVVTRHKQKIINLIANFTHANSTKQSKLNGYGTYNLGLIIYGPPGTGKTLIMKSICNYLKRDAYIVDMRNIKTRIEFENLFLDENLTKKYVFLLDEFDCVQGVIKQRSEKNVENDVTKNKMKDLKDKTLEILGMMANGNEAGKAELKAELENIRKEIKECENALSLDTMLTVLDGMIEMRGRVIIATTNHIEHIDSALLREGRFDAKIELGKFNNDEAHELLEKMFKGTASVDELDYLRSNKIKEDFTPVQLINRALVYNGNVKKLIDDIKIESRGEGLSEK